MSAAARKEMHLAGRDHLLAGELDEALGLFQKAITQHGAHVGPICDIATVYYLQGDMGRFEATLKYLSAELDVAEPDLSHGSMIQTLLILGKFQEENACVAEAILTYRRALKLVDITNIDLEKKIKLQLLRVCAFAGYELTELSALYSDALSLNQNNYDLAIEQGHALMLAEIEMFGLDHAEENLHRLLQNPDLTQYDNVFLLSELLEAQIRTSKPFRQPAADVSQTELFSQEIFKFANSPRYILTPPDFTALALKLPKMSLLRLMSLSLQRSQSSEFFQGIECRYSMILNSLSPASREILLRKWPMHAKAQGTIHFKDGTAIYGEKEALLGRNPVSSSILDFFSKSNHATLEEFTASVFGSAELAEAQSRTRMAVARFNKLMCELTQEKQTLKLVRTNGKLCVAWNSDLTIVQDNQPHRARI